MLIDDDSAKGVDLYGRSIQVQSFCVGGPSGSEQNRVRLEFRAGWEQDFEVASRRAGDCIGGRTKHDRHPPLAEQLVHPAGHLSVQHWHQAISHIRERHARAQCVANRRVLDPNRPAAHDEDVLRYVPEG
jgi:hypothetical protein